MVRRGNAGTRQLGAVLCARRAVNQGCPGPGSGLSHPRCAPAPLALTPNLPARAAPRPRAPSSAPAPCRRPEPHAPRFRGDNLLHGGTVNVFTMFSHAADYLGLITSLALSTASGKDNGAAGWGRGQCADRLRRRPAAWARASWAGAPAREPRPLQPPRPRSSGRTAEILTPPSPVSPRSPPPAPTHAPARASSRRLSAPRPHTRRTQYHSEW